MTVMHIRLIGLCRFAQPHPTHASYVLLDLNFAGNLMFLRLFKVPGSFALWD